MKELLSSINISKWIIYSVLLFIIFLFTPIGIYNSLGIWIAFAEAIICASFVLIGLMGINHINEIFYINDFVSEEKQQQLRLALIPFCVFLFGTITLFFLFEHKIESALKTEGVVTTATILDGSQTVTKSLRRGTRESSEIIFEFKDQNDVVYQLDKSVTNDFFRNSAKGMEIKIKYLPSNPKIFKILTEEENSETTKNIHNNALNFNDIKQVVNLPVDKILPYLKTVNENWIYINSNGKHIFENDGLKELISINSNGEITIKSSISSQLEFVIPINEILHKSNKVEKNTLNYLVQTTNIFELKDLVIKQITGLKKDDSVVELMIITKP